MDLIRPMQETDCETIAAIEKNLQHGWNAQQFIEEIHRHGGWQLVGLVDKTRIAAYICGNAVADQGEIYRLGVAYNNRRQGFATRLLQEALHSLQEGNILHCFLEVRQSNVAGQHLYLKNDFKKVGRRPDYYRHPTEDAIIMRITL